MKSRIINNRSISVAVEMGGRFQPLQAMKWRGCKVVCESFYYLNFKIFYVTEYY